MLHKWLSARDSASKLFVRGGKSYFRRGVEGKFDGWMCLKGNFIQLSSSNCCINWVFFLQ